PGSIQSGLSGNDSIFATGVFSSSELLRLTRASIMMMPNGSHPLIPQGRMDSPSYYNYSPQDHGQPTMVSMHALAMNNGQSYVFCPTGIQHKKLKRGHLNSMSSLDEDGESVEEDDHLNDYYSKMAGGGGGLGHHPSWQGDHMDQGGSQCQTMHSPHMMIPIIPKQEPGYAPLSPSSAMGGQHSRSLVPTPPRPMSTHTPGMISCTHAPGMISSACTPGLGHMVMSGQQVIKYENQQNDTLNDFVTLVCQEAQNSQNHSGQNSPPVRSPNRLPHFFSPGMLPPPPPPPPSSLARPVPLLQISDCHTVLSGHVSVTSAGNNSVHHAASQGSMSGSPTTPPVFTYPSMSPVNAVSGVISPTTLSLITSPVATPRTTPRSTPVPRWASNFISVDENMEYSMLANIMPTVNTDEAVLDRYFSGHSNESLDSNSGAMMPGHHHHHPQQPTLHQRQHGTSNLGQNLQQSPLHIPHAPQQAMPQPGTVTSPKQ
ncbi:unnamed protein product, partial [Candidula unifasciata]